VVGNICSGAKSCLWNIADRSQACARFCAKRCVPHVAACETHQRLKKKVREPKGLFNTISTSVE
jgi:hypothetical protein